MHKFIATQKWLIEHLDIGASNIFEQKQLGLTMFYKT